MKSTRRHELKSNDLAHALEQLGSSFKSWGGYVIGGMAVVFVGVVIFTYMKSARETAQDEAFVQLQKELSPGLAGIPKTNDELLRSISRIADLGEQSSDAKFKIDAIMKRADLALNAAVFGQGGIDLALLKEAKSAFEEIVRDHRNLPIHYGRALFGLYQVEANGFAVDGDPARKEAAEGYLEQLRDDSRLAGVPFQTIAIDRLNELDGIFVDVKFPKQPGSAVQAIVSPSQPSSTVTIGTPKAEGTPTAEPAQAQDSDVDAAADDAVDAEVAEPDDAPTDSDEVPAEAEEAPAEEDSADPNNQ
ncbi:MAG: hypothetical protein DHS20C16_30980 [Phycisphaerae bacterium]|nr:MAG: hypothetical protein DHS20C16_30980 [Phycisphaerae bacterium]